MLQKMQDKQIKDWLGWIGAIAFIQILSGCTGNAAPQPKAITLQQQWVLNPGDRIAGSLVSGSLGDISLLLRKGAQVKAPFDGLLEPSELESCDFYSTPDIPAYQNLMLEKVTNIEVVDNMQTTVILSTFKDSKVVPIQ